MNSSPTTCQCICRNCVVRRTERSSGNQTSLLFQAAAASASDSKNNGAGGLGGKISPSAVLVIKDGNIRLVNVKNQDAVTKVLDMVPDFVNKFTSGKKSDPDVDKAVNDILDGEK